MSALVWGCSHPQSSPGRTYCTCSRRFNGTSIRLAQRQILVQCCVTSETRIAAVQQKDIGHAQHVACCTARCDLQPRVPSNTLLLNDFWQIGRCMCHMHGHTFYNVLCMLQACCTLRCARGAISSIVHSCICRPASADSWPVRQGGPSLDLGATAIFATWLLVVAGRSGGGGRRGGQASVFDTVRPDHCCQRRPW